MTDGFDFTFFLAPGERCEELMLMLPSYISSSQTIGQLHVGHSFGFSALSSKQLPWKMWSFSQSTTTSPMSNSSLQRLQSLFLLFDLGTFGVEINYRSPVPCLFRFVSLFYYGVEFLSAERFFGNVGECATLLSPAGDGRFLNLCNVNMSKLLTTGTSASISTGLLL